VVITNAYSGKLLSFFTTPVYYVDINTLEEVADKIEVVHTFLNVLNPLADGDISDSIKAIERRAKSMPAVDKMGNNQVDQAKLFLKEIRERGKGAMILQKLVIPFFSQLPDEESGNECLVSPGFEAPTVAKGDAILEVANAFFSRLVEGGFYEQWRALQWHKMAANGVTRPLGSAGARKTAPKPLAREQLAGPFLLLSIGLALAAVALAAELLCRPASLSKPSHFLLHRRRHAWE
ncbi:Ionotropic receptor 874, partial [Gryllus bimaculatus]